MFNLKSDFIATYAGKQPDWGPIGYVTYLRTYSRTKDWDGNTPVGREEFWETCKRVVEGVYSVQQQHCKELNLPWNAHKAQRSAQEMYDLMWNFKFLPPGRGLWMMGTEYMQERGGAALNNCAFVSTKELSTDFAAPFLFLMDMSMLGVGVGGDVRGAGNVTIRKPKRGDCTYVVADTREGWVDLIENILNAYIGKGSIPNEIDFSQLREKGTPIKGFGGTSSGYEPLALLVQDIEKTLSPLEGEKITSSAIVDLFNVIGKCVVSGNVRRSAEIMFGDPLDKEFMSLKDPTLHKAELDDHRWASNNSVLGEIGMDYEPIGELIAKNGEPGVIWLDTMKNYGRMLDGRNELADPNVEGSNPCSEQSLESYELCCLVETFPSRCDTMEEYRRVLKYAYLYAKTVTLVPTHNPRTNAVMLRNRRIGTSQSGITQCFSKRSKREHLRWCDEGYTYIRGLDKIYSNWLCIPTSIKVTSVKPSGTVSLLPGVSPGIHYPESQYYIRNIRFDSESPLLGILAKAGYTVVKDTYSKTSSVVSFPVEEKDFSRSINEVSMWEQAEIAAQMQHFWADNQVSVTIRFSKEEAKDIHRLLELYESRLKSISFLPNKDHGYDNAPYIPITKDEYLKMKKKVRDIKANNKALHEDIKEFCDGDKCEVVVS